MSLIVLPDWLKCTSEWLRDQPELTELLDTRVYTELPKSKTFPLLVVNQLNDPPLVEGVHWAATVLFQVDVWGGPKALTWEVAETARALFRQRFTGSHHLEAGSIVVGVVRGGGIRRSTESVVSAGVEDDEEVRRARPRASFDVTAVMHPGRSGS